MTPLTFQVRRDEFNQFFLTATRGGKLVGQAEGYPDTEEGSLYLKWLSVEPRYRRHGYGTALVSALENLAAEWGYEAVVLKPGDRRAALFWEAMGYRMKRGDLYGKWHKPLSLTLRDLAPANPALGPPVPQGFRLFWPNQPGEP